MKKVIGIIGAMQEEIEPLLGHYDVCEEIRVGKMIFYRVELDDKVLFIVKSLIGKVFASMTATLLIEKFECDVVLFTGVAGAVDDCLEIGDVVISDRLVQHDFDITAFGHKHGHIPDAGIFFESNEGLRKAAVEVCGVEGIRFKVGGIATGDQFVNSVERKSFIRDNFDSLALEMEGASVAQVCKYFGVDFLVIRSISDKAQGEANLDFNEFAKSAAVNSSKILIGVVERI